MTNSECRRCSECPDSEHHWLDNGDFGNGDAQGAYIGAQYVCKHCPALGVECLECHGGDLLGGEDSEHRRIDRWRSECRMCRGHGVILCGHSLSEDAE